MGGPNVKLIVKLEGEAKKIQGQREGLYIIGDHLVNNRRHWVQENRKNALWYDEPFGNWKIGLLSGLGNNNKFGLRSKSAIVVNHKQYALSSKEWPENCIWDFFDGTNWKSANMTITTMGKSTVYVTLEIPRS